VQVSYRLQILGTRECVKELVHNLGVEVLTAVVIKSTFVRDTSITLCSLFKVNRHFGGIYHLIFRFEKAKQDNSLKACGMHIVFHVILLKTEAIRSSETSADFQRTTRCYIPVLIIPCCINFLIADIQTGRLWSFCFNLT
jgi:hypothetical protein